MSDCFFVGLDDSECGERALSFACERAKNSGAKLVLAYVIEWSPYSFNTAEENETRHKRREEEVERAQEFVLMPALKKVEELGLEADTVVKHGNVAEVLAKTAKKYNANQIVVGRVGQSGLKSMLFGSVTTKLIQLSDVPVTCVP